jgi:hypothetical protein
VVSVHPPTAIDQVTDFDPAFGVSEIPHPCTGELRGSVEAGNSAST